MQSINGLILLICSAILSSALDFPKVKSHVVGSLNPELTKSFPRDFSSIPVATNLGNSADDIEANKKIEDNRLEHLERELQTVLQHAVTKRVRPIFSTALIAGDAVILDMLARINALSKVPIIFVDTFTLFPETLTHLRELESYYDFKAKVYHAAGVKNQQEYNEKYGEDFWKQDMDKYDLLSKVEPMNRALKEHDSDCWINGRRRDHGADRSFIPVHEGKKLNPLAYWTFEDCWLYLRKHKVPYHPLHDVGYPSLGDVHSTVPVVPKQWFTYGGERSGRFQNLVTKTGDAKTECGIHTEIGNNFQIKA